MIQIEQNPPLRAFLPCECGAVPKHVVSHGRLRGEPLLSHIGKQRHHLECNPCGRRTALHSCIDHAESEWGVKYAQAMLPLRVVAPVALRRAG